MFPSGRMSESCIATPSSTTNKKKLEKKKSESFFNMRKSFSTARLPTTHDDMAHFKAKKLPDNFAEELLNLELDVEQENFDIKSINKLISLYASAVEYFEATKNNKYVIFHHKIQQLLAKPSVMSVLNKEAVKFNTNPINTVPELAKGEDEVVKMMKRQKQQEIKMHVLYAKEQTSEENAREMIISQNQELKKIGGLIQQEMSTQKEQILERLKKRKAAAQMQKSTSVPDLNTGAKKKEQFLKPPLDFNLITNEITEEKDEAENDLNLKDLAEQEKLKEHRKRKSIMMLKKASRDFGALLEKKMSKEFTDFAGVSIERKNTSDFTLQPKKSFESKPFFVDITDEHMGVKEDNDSKEIIFDRLSENSNHHGTHHTQEPEQRARKVSIDELAIKQKLESELERKIDEVIKMFDPQISNLENQIKAEGSSVLLAKILAKFKNQRDKEINELRENYEKKIKDEMK